MRCSIWTLKLWYQSIHRSLHCSNTDFGYDISDYRAIQPEYGTMEDFDLLIQKATELGNVVDFSSAFLISYTKNGSRVPFLVFCPALISNLKFHLSLFSFWKESKSFWILFQIIQATRWVLWVLLFVHSWIIVIVLFHKLQHEWFLRSEAGDPEYADYFIWNEGKMEGDERKPPNNWVSVFRGPAWTYSEKRQAWYFHQFTKQQVSWVLIKIRVWLLSTSTMLCVCFCFRLLTARSELSQSGRCWGDEECAEVLARKRSFRIPLWCGEGLKIDSLYIVLNIQQFSCGSKWWSTRACVGRDLLIFSSKIISLSNITQSEQQNFDAKERKKLNFTVKTFSAFCPIWWL